MERTNLNQPDWLDLIHESVLVCDLDGRIVNCNAAAAKLYGRPRTEAVSRNAHELLRSNYPEPLEAMMVRLRESGAWQGEATRHAADGRELHVELCWSLRRDADGAPLQLIETGRDLTERRRAEQALQRSEHRYRNLFQAMAASFWELDFAAVGRMLRELRKTGVGDLAAYFAAHPEFVRKMMQATRVLDVNEQTVALFGRGSADGLLDNVEPFWPESSYPVYAASVLAAIGGAPHYASETRLRTLDSREFDALFTACFGPDAVGRAQLLIGVIDISARKQALAAMQRMQSELAHAARVSMLGELTASIAHEVNQPLAAIATCGEASLRWLARSVPDLEEVRALTRRSIADARRAADVIARIRAMAARRAPESVLLQLNGVVEEALQFLRHELRAQGVSLRLALAPGLSPVRADRIQLQQVLVNLLVNALQAMSHTHGPQRELTVRTEAVDASLLRVTVEDRGPGIAAEHLPRLFESFFTTKVEGMGMGLPVCRTIIEAHGGVISAGNREDGGGACFAFTLRVAA